MAKKIENLLKLAADMERIGNQDDKLNQLIQKNSSDELDENDLFFVAAASSAPNYEDFLKSEEYKTLVQLYDKAVDKVISRRRANFKLNLPIIYLYAEDPAGL